MSGPNLARDTVIFVSEMFAIGVIWFTFITTAFHLMFVDFFGQTAVAGQAILINIETIVDLSPFIWIPIIIVWYFLRTQAKEHQDYQM
jgi:hypothetical protein